MSAFADELQPLSISLQDAVDSVDWEQVYADTRYLTHDLHRYSGKFIPQVARTAVELLSGPGELIIDPYAGSGTTVLEAGLAGRRVLGVDMNPLAVLIATAKTTPVARERLEEMVATLSMAVAGMSDRPGESSLPGLSVPPEWLEMVQVDPRLHDEWFTKWFELPILRDLILIDVAVNALPHREQRVLGTVALSNILRKSSRAHSGYPNVMFDRKAPARARPGRAFRVSLQRCVAMVSALPRMTGLTVRHGDARRLPVADGAADAIVTHPPYIGSVPYAEYGLISLKWLGHDPRVLDATLTGGRRQSRDVVERFKADYAAAIGDWWRALKPGGGLFLMVGQPVIRGEVVDLPEMSRMLAEAVGFQLEAQAERVGVNRRANKMSAEALLFFRKP